MLKTFKIFGWALSVLCGVAACSCSGERKFGVEGRLDGDLPDMVTLERMDPDAGWVEIGQAEPDGDGTFAFSYEAPAYPQLFRVNCGGRYVYLPVDSTETFMLRANSADISRGFTLSGSPQAEAMTAFEAEALKVEGYGCTDSVQAFKRRVFDLYLKDAKGSIFSYYVLTRKIGDSYLIDYTDPLYSAVATSFKTYKPDDPHTPLLAEQAMKGQREANRRKGKTRVVQAEQTAMLEVTLPDISDNPVSLSSLLDKGKPVVLVFGGMTIPDATVINMELRKLYDAGRCDIYQVCLDPDRFDWAQAAKALPWTVVYDREGLQSTAALRYNLASIPAYFIYDAQGELMNFSTGDVRDLAAHLP